MGAALFVVVAIIIGYLFLISKQRRLRGKSPLPYIGQFLEPLLDAQERSFGSYSETTRDAVPVGRVNDVGEFNSFVVEKQPKKEVRKNLAPMTPTPMPPPLSVTTRPLADSPVTPTSPTPTPTTPTPTSTQTLTSTATPTPVAPPPPPVKLPSVAALPTSAPTSVVPPTTIQVTPAPVQVIPPQVVFVPQQPQQESPDVPPVGVAVPEPDKKKKHHKKKKKHHKKSKKNSKDESLDSKEDKTDDDKKRPAKKKVEADVLSDTLPPLE
uniref:Uncharacterized protein n=1 Tax=Panagrolaimus sp. JU765 TaxID=591449 RepID=A0AC34QJ92_9BILA